MSEIDIQPLRLATVVLPDFHPGAPGTDAVYAFLVRVGGSCTLVDTGVGTGSRLIDRLYQPERVELSHALAEVGAALEDVDAIVSSHLHFDHCGNHVLFPGVPIFVQQAELDAAREPHYTVPEWVDFPGAHYVPVRGRHAISEHLELLPTPGHTPGHQSLLVRSEGRVEIVVAQAAYEAAELELFLAGGLESPGSPAFATLQAFVESNASWSRAAYLSSLAAIGQAGPQRAFFSHDPVAWNASPADVAREPD